MNMSRMVSFGVLVLILLVIGALFYRVISGFLVPAFIAALLGVMFQPLHVRIHKRFQQWGDYFTAGLTTLTVCFIVLTPAVIVITLAVFEGLALANQMGDVSVRTRVDKLRQQLQLDIPHLQDLRIIEGSLERLNLAVQRGEPQVVDAPTLAKLVSRAERLAHYVETNQLSAANVSGLQASLELLAAKYDQGLAFDDALDEATKAFRQFKLNFLGGPYRAWLKELVNPDDAQVDAWRSTWLSQKSPLVDMGEDTVSRIGKGLFGCVIMIATLFFILADGKRLLNRMISFSPLEEHYVRELLAEFDRASRAVVLATLLSALAQGLLAGIGYQFAGVGSVFLLMVFTGILAMVPFLGAASVWISVCLWLYLYDGRMGAAIGLAIYGVLVISMADNIIKPWVLHGQSNLHPLLALLSILGGVQTLGPIGILIGPMSVVFLQTLVRILRREYKVLEQRLTAANHSPPAAAP